jgi:hypothetical protein
MKWIVAVIGAGISMAASPAPPPLTCEPSRVTPRTAEIVLAFGQSHGRELAVVAPDGAFFYLAFRPGDGALPDRVAVRDFHDARRVSLDPRDLDGWRYAAEGAWERVFRLPGIYEFRVADALRTDHDVPEDPMLTCRVEYTPAE